MFRLLLFYFILIFHLKCLDVIFKNSTTITYDNPDIISLKNGETCLIWNEYLEYSDLGILRSEQKFSILDKNQFSLIEKSLNDNNDYSEANLSDINDIKDLRSKFPKLIELVSGNLVFFYSVLKNKKCSVKFKVFDRLTNILKEIVFDSEKLNLECENETPAPFSIRPLPHGGFVTLVTQFTTVSFNSLNSDSRNIFLLFFDENLNFHKSVNISKDDDKSITIKSYPKFSCTSKYIVISWMTSSSYEDGQGGNKSDDYSYLALFDFDGNSVKKIKIFQNFIDLLTFSNDYTVICFYSKSFTSMILQFFNKELEKINELSISLPYEMQFDMRPIQMKRNYYDVATIGFIRMDNNNGWFPNVYGVNFDPSGIEWDKVYQVSSTELAQLWYPKLNLASTMDNKLIFLWNQDRQDNKQYSMLIYSIRPLCEQNCIRCGPTQCLQYCGDGFFKNQKGDCEKCGLKCKICTSSLKCEKCEDGYYFLETKTQENTNNTLTSSNDMCFSKNITLYEPYYLDDNDLILKSCYHTCEICADFYSCKKCKPDFYFIYNSDYKMCLTHSTGYYIEDNFMKKCHESCQTCSSGDSCTTCAPGYIYTNSLDKGNCTLSSNFTNDNKTINYSEGPSSPNIEIPLNPKNHTDNNYKSNLDFYGISCLDFELFLSKNTINKLYLYFTDKFIDTDHNTNIYNNHLVLIEIKNSTNCSQLLAKNEYSVIANKLYKIDQIVWDDSQCRDENIVYSYSIFNTISQKNCPFRSFRVRYMVGEVGVGSLGYYITYNNSTIYNSYSVNSTDVISQKLYPVAKSGEIVWIILPCVLGFLLIVLIILCLIGVIRFSRKKSETSDVQIRENRKPYVNPPDNMDQVVPTENFNRPNTIEIEIQNNFDAPAPVEK